MRDMLDIRFIREHAADVQENARRKGYDVNIDELLRLDQAKRQLQQQADELREKRNEVASRMKGGRPTDELVAEGKAIKDRLAGIEVDLRQADEAFTDLLKKVPNMALADVPVGATEDENVVAKKVGEPTRFDFVPKNHAELAGAKGWLDKERAAKVTGSRFAYLKGDLVKLQFALIQFVMEKLSDQAFINEIIVENNLNVSNKPFLPVLPPLMLRTEMFAAMDRLEPSDDRYKIEDEELWLQGSAEHVLGSMHADEIFDESDLPVRYLGYATSFRREAGTYGKDMEGMFRMHQFDKLEMESLGTKESGLDEHLFMIAIQEKIMQLLGIPYQVLLKCTADIGKPNARGVDIEAWLPGQDKYRETHTADYMTDYQARRLKTRVRKADGTVELIHTNDATALPLSRGPIAILENYQQSDGSVKIPDVLRPYFGGRGVL
jgi:seryl-tRNA synthetase